MILNKTAVWWINFIAVLALTQPLDGCNKIAQKTPSQCKDISIQNKLLDLSSLKIMTNPQLNSNIINITTLEKFTNRITNCRAIIDYRYSIIPTKNYRLAYDFTINDDGEITKLVPQNNLKNTEKSVELAIKNIETLKDFNEEEVVHAFVSSADYRK